MSHRSTIIRTTLFLFFSMALACGDEDPGPDSMGTGGTVTGGQATGGSATGGSGVASGGVGATGGVVSGGTSSGGAVTSGGASSGGTSSGGANSGGTESGGAASGGASASGGSDTGGASASGGEGSGGAGSGGADFALSSPVAEGVVDNDDCTSAARDTCPLYPQENVSEMIGGENISPELSWTAGPEGTQSYVVVLHDFTDGFNNTHWAVYDIPASAMLLAGDLPAGNLSDPAGAKQAGFNNAGNMSAYFGSGACGNVYEFRIYALSTASLEGSIGSASDVRSALMSSSDVLSESFIRVQSRDYCE